MTQDTVVIRRALLVQTATQAIGCGVGRVFGAQHARAVCFFAAPEAFADKNSIKSIPALVRIVLSMIAIPPIIAYVALKPKQWLEDEE